MESLKKFQEELFFYEFQRKIPGEYLKKPLEKLEKRILGRFFAKKTSEEMSTEISEGIHRGPCQGILATVCE